MVGYLSCGDGSVAAAGEPVSVDVVGVVEMVVGCPSVCFNDVLVHHIAIGIAEVCAGSDYSPCLADGFYDLIFFIVCVFRNTNMV